MAAESKAIIKHDPEPLDIAQSIGTGTYGHVYIAIDNKENEYALKVITLLSRHTKHVSENEKHFLEYLQGQPWVVKVYALYNGKCTKLVSSETLLHDFQKTIENEKARQQAPENKTNPIAQNHAKHRITELSDAILRLQKDTLECDFQLLKLYKEDLDALIKRGLSQTPSVFPDYSFCAQMISIAKDLGTLAIVHGDLAPRNFLWDYELISTSNDKQAAIKRVVVSDFGFAKHVGKGITFRPGWTESAWGSNIECPDSPFMIHQILFAVFINLEQMFLYLNRYGPGGWMQDNNKAAGKVVKIARYTVLHGQNYWKNELYAKYPQILSESNKTMSKDGGTIQITLPDSINSFLQLYEEASQQQVPNMKAVYNRWVSNHQQQQQQQQQPPQKN